MAKLWFKNYDLNELLEKFTVGNDYILDKNLVVSDCLCSIAHIQMLSEIGILTKAEFKSLKAALLEIIKLDREGKFEIKLSDEDCHTARKCIQAVQGTTRFLLPPGSMPRSVSCR